MNELIPMTQDAPSKGWCKKAIKDQLARLKAVLQKLWHFAKDKNRRSAAASWIFKIVIVGILLMIVSTCIWNAILAPIGRSLAVKLPIPQHWFGKLSGVSFWIWSILFLTSNYNILKLIFRIFWRDNKTHVEDSVSRESDAPINTIAEDRLYRSPCINRIADFLETTKVDEQGVFWGMFAPWGEGKTSLMNLVEEEISQRSKNGKLPEKIVFVNFDAWKFLTAEDAVASLSYAIAEKLDAAGNKALASTLRAYGYMIAGKRTKSSFRSFASFIEGLQLLYFCYNHKELSIERTLRQDLVTANIRIVLVVDDLERMPHDDAFRIIRFLKSNFSLPKMIVAVLSDKQHLLKAITKGMGSEQKGEDERYLEKLIPLQFEVPKATTDSLISYVKEAVNSILKNHTHLDFYQDSEEDFDSKLLGHYIQNMRAAKRFVSKFESNLLFQGQLTKSKSINVHVGDLLALTVMQIWEERVYKDLPSLVAKIRDSKTSCSLPAWGMAEDEYEQWLKDHCNDEKSKELVKEFLKNRLKVGSVSYQQKAYYQLRAWDDMRCGTDRRLCSAAYFDKYYNNFSDSNFIDVEIISSIENAIAHGTVPQNLLLDLIESHKISALLHNLQGHKQFQSVESDQKYFEMLIWLSNQHFDSSHFMTELVDVAGQKTSFVNNIYINIFYCISYYCSHYHSSAGVFNGHKVQFGFSHPSEAGKILFDVLKSSSSCHILCYLLDFDEDNHKRFITNKQPNNHPILRLFTDEQYDELAKMYLDCMDRCLGEGLVFSSHNEYDLLTRWIKVLKVVKTPQQWNRARNALSNTLSNWKDKTAVASASANELQLYRAISIYDNTFYAKACGGVMGFNGIDLMLAIKLRGKSKMNRLLVELNRKEPLNKTRDPIVIALMFLAINKYRQADCEPELQLRYVRQKLQPQRPFGPSATSILS